MQLRQDSFGIFNLILFIVMAFAVVICIVPFIYMIALSFSDPAAIMQNKVSFLPVGFTTAAYKQIFTYPNFFKAYGNTIFYTFFGTLIALCFTSTFAYPLSKKFLRGTGIIMKLVVFSMFFSGGLIPTYLLISSLHLTGTVFAILLPFAINQFHLIILINFFKAFPHELEEAALIDGLGYFRIFTHIVIPLSTPALAAIGLYTAVFFWNDWFNGLIYTRRNFLSCYFCAISSTGLQQWATAPAAQICRLSAFRLKPRLLSFQRCQLSCCIPSYRNTL